MTAIEAHYGLLMYTRVPSGLKSDPAAFQKSMDVILATVKWLYALVHIDGITTIPETPEDSVKDIEEVLKLINST